MDPKSILRRYAALKTSRSSIEDLWDYMERFVGPWKGQFYQTEDDEGNVDWRRREIYDSTAIDAAQSLAANITGSLVSQSTRWFDLRFRDYEHNYDDPAVAWLEKASEAAYYALIQSNFNLEMDECMSDLVTFGTAILVEEPDEETGELIFTSIPIHQAYFELDSKNHVLRLYRRMMWTVDQIVDKWGDDAPDYAKKAVKEGKDTTEKNEIVYCCYKRTDVDDKVVVADAHPTRRPYGYKYVDVTTREEIGEEGGYHDMPAFAVRWRTTAGSVWGNAPGMVCLSNIMSLNQVIESLHESVELMIAPPLMTTQSGIIGDIDMRRHGVTTVSDTDDLKPLPVGGDVGVSIPLVEDLRGQIRRSFFEDQLELKESPAMTATEVNVRYRLMERLLGPTLGRLQDDLLDPLIDRTLAILLRTGQIEQPPQEVYEAGSFDVEYTGPLPRSQKSDTAAAILGWVGSILSASERKPEVLDIPNFDDAFTRSGQLTGVPTTSINSEEVIKAIRDARMAEIKRQQGLEEAERMSSAVRNVGSAPPALIEAMQGSIPPREAR